MRKDSIKNIRINANVQREISKIIRGEIKDPRILPMTGVTECIVTTDLKLCTVYVSVLGTDEEAKNTLEGLKSASGYMRRELAHRLNLRNTPELRFVLDTSLAYGMKMNQLIDEVMKHASDEKEFDERESDKDNEANE